ncbi:MAG: helix-turn-helix domain-containing protein [Rhizobacter sp.]|nr:helix-turn-helix domain-containing protein [Rhizobacter sp.]
MSLGERLKSARERIGLSQVSLAELVGINQSTISDLERGINSDPGAERLIRLAEALKVDPKHLLFGDEAPLNKEGSAQTEPKSEEQEDLQSLLRVFQRLTPPHRRALLAIARALRNAEHE